jgi:excisionase family DNA binding protein
VNQKDLLNEEYFNVKEAANYLRLSVSKIYKMIEFKEIKHRNHGGGRRIFAKSDLDAYSNSCIIQALTPHALPFQQKKDMECEFFDN